MPRRKAPAEKRSYGEGSVYQRSRDGRWVAAMPCPGQKTPLTKYFHTEREARLFQRETLKAIDNGSFAVPSRQLLGDYLDDWIAGREHELEPSSIRIYKQVLAPARLKLLRDVELGKLRPSQIEAALRDLSARGYATSTVQKTRTVISSALSDAVRLEVMPSNPAVVTRAPRNRGAIKMHIWEPEEIRAFLAEMAPDRLAALWLLSVTLGWRNGEARGLFWTDVDWTKQTIAVGRSLDRWALRDSEGKTKKTRVLQLSNLQLAALKAHRATQREERLATGSKWKETRRIFTRPNGEPLTYPQMVYRFHVGCRAAEVPQIRLHDLRHTAISWMLSQNVPIATVAAIAGHASPSMTLSRYAHALPQDFSRALSAMDALVLGVAPQEQQIGG